MPDSQADISEPKPPVPQEPQVEKGGEFKKVTAEELDFLHEFNNKPGVSSGPSERLERLKEEDPQFYERYQDINGRRIKELRGIDSPYISEFHRFGKSETETNRYGNPLDVSFEEMQNRLQEAKQWKQDWDNLSNEEKITRCHRIKELRGAKNIPEGDLSTQNYTSQIANMERNAKGAIRGLEVIVESLNVREFDDLRQFFDGHPSAEKLAERWSNLEQRDTNQYKRMQRIYNRFQRELELKEPPFTTEQSRFYDVKSVRIEGVRSREIDQMDIPALKALLERSEAFSERWDKLSDAQRIEQLKRVRRLKGGTLLEGEREGIRPYLKEGETVEGKGVEFWTSGIKEQIRNLQEAITTRETQKQQQELEPTRAAIKEASHNEEPPPAPQETLPPPTPPKSGGLLSRIFGRK